MDIRASRVRSFSGKGGERDAMSAEALEEIELFQLLDPPHDRREPSLEYWKSGFFHICVTDPNIEELATRIAASGGRQRSKIWRINPETEVYRLCYCEDPFGNIIEIYTHNYETMYGGIQLERPPKT
jgi:catechol 2,3-dioxygenase-like lactoylglutathione lyase family enzyme